jgi:hypothetical protein
VYPTIIRPPDLRGVWLVLDVKFIETVELFLFPQIVKLSHIALFRRRKLVPFFVSTPVCPDSVLDASSISITFKYADLPLNIVGFILIFIFQVVPHPESEEEVIVEQVNTFSSFHE